MARFRNKTDQTLSVNRAPGHPDAHPVKPGDALKVPGEATETDDAYVVGAGDRARAYPKALWEAESDPAPKSVTSKKEGERS